MNTPEGSARIAWAEDAAAIAQVQVSAWRAAYAGLLPVEVLRELDPATVAAQWRTALVAPADARHRVLAALSGADLVGFALTLPCPDPDADPVADGAIEELTIAPDHRGQGHGSRLLQAAADTLRADHFTRGTCWVTTTDDDLRRFLTDAGWAADGATRELASESGSTVRQVRLHTSL